MLGEGKRREALMLMICAGLGMAAIVLLSIGIATESESLGRMIAQARQAMSRPKPTPAPITSVPTSTADSLPQVPLSVPHGPIARDVAAWITSDDYPVAALNAGQHGTVAMKLQIDASGTVIGCSVTQSSGVAELDQATCRLGLTRARFFPARNAAGVALPATWRRRIVRQLPE